ncbi:uncharacterized protein LOC106052218 [Biomphalaria glabrata]|uniref:Uncharacterized protein LOC106052218 n=1 Tax=Biomphalaria glabrata TaxID=6526 RepID=A0A9W2ZH23_BIOGL|nr:uncharacterized protein LOC106052218 [Biomphalaria glabrata]
MESATELDLEESSDDELEDIETFIQTPSKCFSKYCLSPVPNGDALQSHIRPNEKSISKNLDTLLQEVRLQNAEEDDLNKMKKELWSNIVSESETIHQDTMGHLDLASEHADHINQLEVKTSQLTSVYPGLEVFHPDLFCCLFTEHVSPSDFGFIPVNTVDFKISEIIAEDWKTLLMSNTLLPLMSKISCVDKIMMWLWNLMSVCTCTPAIISNLLRHMVKRLANERVPKKTFWCPNSQDLLRLLVNLGARPEDLQGRQTFFSIEEVSTALRVTKQSTEKTDPITDEMFADRFKTVLDILSLCLQTSPLQNKKDISSMFYMLATTALHAAFPTSLSWEFEVCLTSLLECYKSCDWQEVLPELSRCLLCITDHHHNQAHLLDLMPRSSRGRCLRQMLGVLFLHCQLAPMNSPPNLDYETLKLSDILQIGSRSKDHTLTPLCSSLQSLITTDLYKLSSVITLVDKTVGNEKQRGEQSVAELQFLINEIQKVIKIIRDNMNNLDYSRVKDSLTCLTMKWSLTLQDAKSQEKTIFNWATARPHQPVQPEVLRDIQNLEMDDDGDSC